MVELVQLRIRKELQKTKGSLIFDWWSKKAFHHVIMIPPYMVNLSRYNMNELKKSIEQILSLIALSLMEKWNATQDSNARDERLERGIDSDSND